MKIKSATPLKIQQGAIAEQIKNIFYKICTPKNL
jgi:hypothetical protein